MAAISVKRSIGLHMKAVSPGVVLGVRLPKMSQAIATTVSAVVAVL